jgi:hypothetical protein
MKNMRELINLMEGVMAVPGIGEGSESDMQTAGTVGRNQDYAEFDAEQSPVTEKAPEGWEGTVKAMKKHPEIDNPWALAHYMKNKGYKHHKEESVEMMEKAPPGMEDVVMKLKDEYGHDKKGMEKAFATAWSIYNKKHGKKEEACAMEESVPAIDSCNQANPENADAACAMEEGVDDEVCQNAKRRFWEMCELHVEPDTALQRVEHELREMGIDEDEISEIKDAIYDEYGVEGSDEEPMGSHDMSDDAEALASAGRGSDEDYGYYQDDNAYDLEISIQTKLGQWHLFHTRLQRPVHRKFLQLLQQVMLKRHTLQDRLMGQGTQWQS